MAAARMVFLLMLAAVLLVVAGEHPVVPVSGQERAPLGHPPAEQHRRQSAMPGTVCFLVPVARGLGATAGAVEEDKAYIVGRPLFKVPPSSPCRSKAKSC
ncbi:unnamed protein product [Urochloa decumbens]|uniref:Uncharacterized protein n=1 Tax=Urochloa decumbens TaxID=240449 RepID=A0ABC9BTY7_9POAL